MSALSGEYFSQFCEYLPAPKGTIESFMISDVCPSFVCVMRYCLSHPTQPNSLIDHQCRVTYALTSQILHHIAEYQSKLAFTTNNPGQRRAERLQQNYQGLLKLSNLLFLFSSRGDSCFPTSQPPLLPSPILTG
jgi:hypothetical protein